MMAAQKSTSKSSEAHIADVGDDGKHPTLFNLLVIFLPENVLPVCNLCSTCWKGGHTVLFVVITHKAKPKCPASSVIPADVSVNPIADPPKAPCQVQ